MPDCCVVVGMCGEVCCIPGWDVVATVVAAASDGVTIISAVAGILVTAVGVGDADLLNCSEEKP